MWVLRNCDSIVDLIGITARNKRKKCTLLYGAASLSSVTGGDRRFSEVEACVGSYNENSLYEGVQDGVLHI